MYFAATIRVPDMPPSRVPPFSAESDAMALEIVRAVATRAGADVGMVWESRDGQCRKIAA